MLTMTLTSEVKSPATTRGVVCLCLAMSVQLLAGADGEFECAHGRGVENLSEYSLSCEMARSMDGLLAVFTEDEWTSLTPQTLDGQARFLVGVARHLDLQRHRKSRRGPKKKPPREPVSKTVALSLPPNYSPSGPKDVEGPGLERPS